MPFNPDHLWQPEYFRQLGKKIGPTISEATAANLSCARICVELYIQACENQLAASLRRKWRRNAAYAGSRL